MGEQVEGGREGGGEVMEKDRALKRTARRGVTCKTDKKRGKEG